MAEKSAIEWTDATWNIVTGCSLVSPACTNCYAMRLAGTRMKNHPSRQGLTREVNGKHVWTGEVRFNESWLLQPLEWKRPRKIFVAAHRDLFHDAVSDEQRDLVFAAMALCPHHTFQVLTKRPARMRKYISGESWKIPMLGAKPLERIHLAAAGHMEGDGGPLDALKEAGNLYSLYLNARWPLPNVWLGVTVEDQRRADERIPDLLATPAAVRFVSIEPMLGAVDLRRINLQPRLWIDCIDRRWPERFAQFGAGRGLDLVIAGGESGPGARSTPLALFRSLRDQCAAAGVAFDFKQWGEWIDADQFLALVAPERVAAGPLTFVGATKLGVDCLAACEHHSDGSSSLRVGKRRAGRLLDGREHNGTRRRAQS